MIYAFRFLVIFCLPPFRSLAVSLLFIRRSDSEFNSYQKHQHHEQCNAICIFDRTLYHFLWCYWWCCWWRWWWRKDVTPTRAFTPSHESILSHSDACVMNHAHDLSQNFQFNHWTPSNIILNDKMTTAKEWREKEEKRKTTKFKTNTNYNLEIKKTIRFICTLLCVCLIYFIFSVDVAEREMTMTTKHVIYVI